MKLIKTKARLLLTTVIIAAFFIPAYESISGFRFINFALDHVKVSNELTKTDVLIAIIPLVAVPASALVILLATLLRKSICQIYLAFPLVFILFFLGIMFMGIEDNSDAFSSPKVLLQMQAGFYICVLASALLIYTKNHKKRRRKKRVYPNTEVVATASV